MTAASGGAAAAAATAVAAPDVVVVGGGLEGTSIAWALTQRRAGRVTILERATVGSGGTGKSSGVVRCHYGVPSLAAMAITSLPTFEQAEEIFGHDIGFRQCGYLVGVGPANVAALQANLTAQQAVGVQVEQIDHDAAAALWPAASLADFGAFGYEARGGYGDAYSTAQAFSAAARSGGTTLRQGCRVVEILVTGGSSADGSRVSGVRLDDGTTIPTGTVVVAAGPWSVGLLAPLHIELPITVHHEPLVLVDPGGVLGPVPVFSDLVSLQYVKAEVGGHVLFGNSDLAVLNPADPDRYSNRAGPKELDSAVEKMAHRFPGFPDPSVTGSYAGCYDVTPDFNPVISDTDVEGLFVAAGFSGHGFKISPAVGTLMADLIVDGKSSHADIPAADFRLSRFAEDDLLRSPHPYVGAGEMR